MQNYTDEFIKLINRIDRTTNLYKTFSDFVTFASISFQNAIPKSDELEKRYMETASRYSKEQMMHFSQLLTIVVEAMEVPHDFLGQAFMQSELGNDRTGQFFTPSPICELMAKINAPSKDDLLAKPFVTFYEPACGSGAMVIAFVKNMLDLGVNPQERLWVSAWDIDSMVARMCYIHLTLLHIPAEIVIVNSLTMEVTEVLYTPAHYLGAWEKRLKWQTAFRELRSLIGDSSESEATEKVFKPGNKAEDQVLPGALLSSQVSFDF